MSNLSGFTLTHTWLATQPDRLRRHSLPTPHGVKVPIVLEEVGLAYGLFSLCGV